MNKKKSAKAKPQARNTKKMVLKKEERRSDKRFSTLNVWATEKTGDFLFQVKVSNLSEGGCFVEGKLKTKEDPSLLKISHRGVSLEIQAQPLHDTVDSDVLGTGYCFINNSPAQMKALRSFLRNFN